MQNPMNILLIEDDEKLCQCFISIIDKRDDIRLISKTDSGIEALEIVKRNKLDGIIVDLELHSGESSGFEFLHKLKQLNINPKPIIIVNTNIISNVVYDKLHEEFADVIFYKKQKDYSPNKVIDTLLLLRRNDKNNTMTVNKKYEDENRKIDNLIKEELDLIGISYKLKGREYIAEAIAYILQEDNKELSPFQFLANKHKLLTSSISRAIQTAINETWRTSAIEDLKMNYTAKINYHTGVPTPTEFIYFYSQRIKEMIEND